MNTPNFLYREAAVRGASKVRLVVLLYEQIIRDLNRALAALEQNSIEKRTLAINHAMTVIGHLQSTLDLEVKAPVVFHLSRFYSTLRARLFEAQAHASSQILTEQITYLLDMREAWMEVDRVDSAAASLRPGAPAAGLTAPGTTSRWEG